MKLACVLMAAGNSSRFGEDKLWLPVKGQPMGIHTLDVLLQVPFDMRVLVTSADKEYLIEAAVKRGFDVVINPAPEQGMSVSVRMGTAHIMAASEYDGILYAVADQPGLSSATVKRLMKAFAEAPEYIWAPQANGKRGNPVIFPPLFFDKLLEVTGDSGGRQVIAAYPELLRTVTVAAEELKDIDTKEDAQTC